MRVRTINKSDDATQHALLRTTPLPPPASSTTRHPTHALQLILQFVLVPSSPRRRPDCHLQGSTPHSTPHFHSSECAIELQLLLLPHPPNSCYTIALTSTQHTSSVQCHTANAYAEEVESISVPCTETASTAATADAASAAAAERSLIFTSVSRCNRHSDTPQTIIQHAKSDILPCQSTSTSSQPGSWRKPNSFPTPQCPPPMGRRKRLAREQGSRRAGRQESPGALPYPPILRSVTHLVLPPSSHKSCNRVTNGLKSRPSSQSLTHRFGTTSCVT
ncbi:hypothetical protein TcWFU_002296 [Taenia crassiceps]|uniref:Uncharacterized protein n=1 Tax=Taenia crassiceps TaxID=6207 RepID=A0ABR4Q7V8_9CEST